MSTWPCRVNRSILPVGLVSQAVDCLVSPRPARWRSRSRRSARGRPPNKTPADPQGRILDGDRPALPAAWPRTGDRPLGDLVRNIPEWWADQCALLVEADSPPHGARGRMPPDRTSARIGHATAGPHVRPLRSISRPAQAAASSPVAWSCWHSQSTRARRLPSSLTLMRPCSGSSNVTVTNASPG